MDAYPSKPLLNYNILRGRFASERESYAAAAPCPHQVFDYFIEDTITAEVLPDFPPGKGQPGDHPQHRQSPQLLSLSPITRQLVWELNSSTFIRILEGLTGIEELIPDPKLANAGLRWVFPGEHIAVHNDPTPNNPYDLERRIRLELTLNRDWRADYEGHLELWNADLTQCVKRIAPEAGRCLILSTTPGTYRGLSVPLACPADASRKSIVVYYYTLGRQGVERLAEKNVEQLQADLPPPQ